MKNKTQKKLLGIITSLGLCASLHAQDGSGGIGVGVGLGIGIGTGVGANINVVRVPGNVVQGRRVYAAMVVSGSETTTHGVSSPFGGSSSAISGIPRGYHAGFNQSGTAWWKEYGTVVSVFNPGTNSVTFTSPLSGVVTVPPGGSQHLYFGNRNWLNPSPAPGPLPGGPPAPPPFLRFTTDFLAIESQAPLEVVALYRYRDERIDSASEAMVETAAGMLIGP
jgi:hypothetical protein